MSGADRIALEARWLDLVRRELPAIAAERRWPVRVDHCFARVLLDAACGAPWRERVRPPAYRNLPSPLLERAVELAEGSLAGRVDLPALNRRSLDLRRAARLGLTPGPAASGPPRPPRTVR